MAFAAVVAAIRQVAVALLGHVPVCPAQTCEMVFETTEEHAAYLQYLFVSGHHLLAGSAGMAPPKSRSLFQRVL